MREAGALEVAGEFQDDALEASGVLCQHAEHRSRAPRHGERPGRPVFVGHRPQFVGIAIRLPARSRADAADTAAASTRRKSDIDW
jgi:hypothetical protein